MANNFDKHILDKNEIGILRKTNGIDINTQMLAASFLSKLIYFDIFSYPLTQKEIFEYSSRKMFKESEGISAIENLMKRNLISYHLGYYYLGSDSGKVGRRIEGNKLAEKRMKNARFFSAIIASFPFTRGVYISGSLSKGFMDEKSDIDYFILTSPNRLWLCRTLLILFKKIFLFNSHKNFCINYLVDTDNLEIKERNIYSATEVALLLPVYNYQLFGKFMEANGWIKTFYPNLKKIEKLSVKGIPFLKKFFELILDNRIGDLLDNFFYKITVVFWEKKHQNMNINNPDSEVVLNKHVSQYNPRHFRGNVLSRYRQKIVEFETRTGIVIGEN